MKKLLLFFSMFLTYLGSNAQGIWVSQSTGSTEVSTGLRDIEVVDTSVVWVITYDGSGGGLPRQDYSRTSDGGATWTPGIVPTSNQFWDWAQLTAINDSVAWAVFFNQAVNPVGLGQIWHTTDAGTSWAIQDSGLIFSSAGESFPNVIHFWNEDSGVVIGDPVSGEFEIYTTVDGGDNWVPVLSANIPDPLTGEAGWTTHIETMGDTVWFDTNNGRVYRSVDRGYTWTVSATGLPVPVPGTIDITFYGDGTKGIARFYTAPLGNDIVETMDGGLTWSAVFAPTGNFFGAAVESVPGTAAMLVSTGVAAPATGSSYSNDGGHSWTDLETGTQRNALGIADSLTMWCGGFTTSPTDGGIFKWTVLQPIACNDPSVTPGTVSIGAGDSVICGGDTAVFTSTGIVSPFIGDFSGLAWVLTSADITGSPNPLIEPSFFNVGTQIVNFPVPSTNSIIIINDGTIIDGANNPYGVYYITPVVFGNAVALNIPVIFLQDLTLDDASPCTYVGTSIAVEVKDPTDPDCTGISVGEIKGNQLAVYTSIKDRTTLDVLINSAGHGKVNIQVTDVMGRLVKTVSSYVSKGTNHEYINVEDLSAGTYIVKANVNGNFATNKVVKY